MRKSSRRPRGFLMIEMIAAIVLLTAFALIAAPLFNETMHVIERAPGAQDSMTRFESASQTLREDAWGARAFSSVGPNAVEINLPSNANIRWQIDPDGDIERQQGDEQRRWSGVGASAVLEAAGPWVVLRSTARAADAQSEICCTSVLQLAAEGDHK
jgi:type II secretory pathway pseudopilin PulG